MFEKWQEQMDKGRLAMTRRDFASAEKHFLAATQEAEKFGCNNQSLAQSLEMLGESILSQAPSEKGKVDRCYACLERACSIYESELGPVHLKVAQCLTSMAKLLLWFDSSEAEKILRRAISIHEELNSDGVAEPTEILSSILKRGERTGEPEVLQRSLVSRFDNKAETTSVSLAKSKILLARKSYNRVEAISQYKQALSLLPDNNDQIALIVETHVALAKLLFEEEAFTAAEEAFEIALLRGSCSPSVSSTIIEEAMCRLARLKICYHQDFQEAERLINEAEAVREPEGLRPFDTCVEMERSYLWIARGDKKSHEEDLRAKLTWARKQKAAHRADWKYVNQLTFVMQSLSLAALIYKRGNHDEAFKLWEEIIENEVPGNWMSERALFKLAIGYAEHGRIEQSRKLADRGLKSICADTISDNIALGILAEHAIGRKEKIEPLIDIVRQQIEKILKEEIDEYGTLHLSYMNLTFALSGIGRTEDAIVTMNEMFAKEKKQDSLFTAITYENWADSFDDEKAHTLASRLRERAKKIRANIFEREKEYTKSLHFQP